MSIFWGDPTTPVWGGWVTGPTLIGPEEFARAGYDYVGFDAQHSYLDDAEIAAILRRIEHVPIATVVRLPNADPAPIGRVLDAGADGVVIAMIESADEAAAAVAATRYPITASIGIVSVPLGSSFDPAERDLIDDLVNLADTAMYAAKRAGGNQSRCTRIPHAARRGSAA